MSRAADFKKRIELLEARSAHACDPDCDPRRRFARYVSYFNGQPWTCLNPEKRAMQEASYQADLARYREYFDSL